ncbi:MAG: Proteasome-activating nucleotidase [Candidatus Heimdallarchaeota archaeon LC_3]|nr:MAG: Proteasome-activating nucleotidase [Candidatus Heimdallarchaeota archaeon LC_3]
MAENYDEISSDFINIQQENEIQRKIRAIKNEAKIIERQKNDLTKQLREIRSDISKLRRAPLVVGSIIESIPKSNQVVVRSTTGPQFVVHHADTLDSDDLIPNTNVALNQRYFSVVGILPSTQDPLVRGMEYEEKPNVNFNDIGALSDQILEICEAIELSLKYPERFSRIGIESPKGVLLYGPPGSGKTLIAKAIASETNASFISVVGSELVQKYIGEGARLVRDLFQFARKKAPAIIFIDELDAIGARRTEISTSGDREVARTLLQLFVEIDGFKSNENVKIIGSTNRPDILDPALMRPGRFDRHVKIPMPNKQGRLEILSIHSRNLNVKKDINFHLFTDKMDGFTGADIHSVCQEAGMNAIKARRVRIKNDDFLEAIIKVKLNRKEVENENSITYA